MIYLKTSARTADTANMEFTVGKRDAQRAVEIVERDDPHRQWLDRSRHPLRRTARQRQQHRKAKQQPHYRFLGTGHQAPGVSLRRFRRAASWDRAR